MISIPIVPKDLRKQFITDITSSSGIQHHLRKLALRRPGGSNSCSGPIVGYVIRRVKRQHISNGDAPKVVSRFP